MKAFLLIVVLVFASPLAQGSTCGSEGASLQVLGSGGSDLAGQRAASSYVLWLDGKARVLVDAGGGAALRFAQSGANFADLDVILLTHLHADHAGDLPALMASARSQARRRPLPLFGPEGSRTMPSTVALVRALFDPTRGAYRYLSDVLSPQDSDGYKLRPRDVTIKKKRENGPAFSSERVVARAVPGSHAGGPALAWRVRLGERDFTFIGDVRAPEESLAGLAKDADMLIAPHAITDDASGAERTQYLTPGEIARVATAGRAKSLLFSHRTARMLGRESETTTSIKKSYGGTIAFADDLACFRP